MGENDVGRRIREVRAWRGLSLRATAELAGITHGTSRSSNAARNP